MNEASGGGGGPVLDYAAMSAAAEVLASAAGNLDASGIAKPCVGDLGDAAPLVAAILGAFADTGARVSAEAATIGSTVQVCSAGMQGTDAEQAVAVLRNGVAR